MKSKFEVKGLDEYLEALKAADQNINQVARAALAEVGPILQTEMVRRVPVDTGNLRDHILIKTPTREGDYNYIFVGIIHEAAFTDAKTAIYANVIEFGSRHAPAQPFVRPAIRSKRGTVLKLIESRLREAALID